MLDSGNGGCCHHSSLYDEGVTVGNCRMNHLLLADDLVLHAWIFLTGSSTRILSIFCCVRPSRNENQQKNIEILCLSKRPRQCILHVSANTLQQAGTFKYLGVVFRSDGGRNTGIDTRISKANAVQRRGGSN